MRVNINMDEMSRHLDFTQKALCATGIHLCLGPALPSPIAFHFLSARAFADAVPPALTCFSLPSCFTFFLLNPSHLQIASPGEPGPPTMS